jgi:alkanesulfonate monooxygenase SsuD/methylene tetrahydromethanopterin reductase-like flavin-dependent oxidoreductase (luciferase family)
MRPLKVGVQLPEVERPVPWPEVRQIAQAAEEVGFDSIWVGDHLLYRNPGEPAKGPWEAWSQLSALAEITHRVQIGPLVASTSFHNPVMIAKKAATIDAMSDGRLILGLGAGWNEVEYRAYGFPFDKRISRFKEAFTIIRTLLREGAIDFQGQFYMARDCELLPRSPRPEGPPLLIGSSGERMLRITMPHANAWNAWFADTGNSPAGVAPLRNKVDAACREVGREPAEIERTVAVLIQLPGGTGRATAYEEDDPRRSSYEPLRGDEDELAASLAAYARAGISHLQLVVDPITVDSIELLGRVLERLDAL